MNTRINVRALGTGIAFLTALFILPGVISAQVGPGVPGNSAVYSGSSAIAGSAVIVDATAYAGTDICNILYTILSSASYPGGGLLIDARGITNPPSLNCKSGTPWIQNNSSPTNNPPTSAISTILLPAGTITIYTSWVLPNYTRLIGEGERTIISAGQGYAPPAWDTNSGGTGMIEIGAFATTKAYGNFPAPGPFPCVGSSPCICPIARNGPACAGIGVQDLVLDGSQLGSTPLNGIYNAASQEMTYVDHVTMNNIEGIGLRIFSVNSGGSGPYSNIVFNAGRNARAGTIANGGTACVDIESLIRGIHGITCAAQGLSGSPAAAIYVDGGYNATLDGGGNTIDDVHVDGFQDGILFGSQIAAPGYILLNINGSNVNNATDLKNVIHICGTPAVAPCPSPAVPVLDLTMMGVTSSASGVNTIEDDLTQTTLQDPSVGMYVLGAPFMNGTTIVGFPRFTTSPSVATWGIGTGTVSGSCPTAANGSLFSKTNGAPGSTLYLCAPASPTSSTWRAIK